mmetsp:Transcript_20135/g.80961  ORF Transcript_20135/g.80961 Transcript_20135/m.80961 type:complete len:250 (-) Transcript_20135:877-1626(-)|eukprot:CAMPEP_0113954372 /NCGR_PEP_ID=MMETSP0011_2-20120614/491_1 /TAXON_ID=101924 /ORGANISM="Rhodosorus marinus" /LENGTH=249 /DNA_ID=CAMNT_0000963443 /DNA_START=72 /DNA_END=821 /DNA_ORIENTATION=+ /assembly_acc=CAM_ASM_000156
MEKQTKGKKKKKAKSSLKSQIRGIERLLSVKGEELPEKTRLAKQEELEELKRVQQERHRRENKRLIKVKYRRFRWYERKKLMRMQLHVEKLLENGEIDQETAMTRKEQIYKDLLYVKMFPDDRPYLSLFPHAEHGEEAKAEIETIRAAIEQRIVRGAEDDLEEDDEETNAEGGDQKDIGTAEEDSFFVEQEDDDEGSPDDQRLSGISLNPSKEDDRGDAAAEEKGALQPSQRKKTRRGARGKRSRKRDT